MLTHCGAEQCRGDQPEWERVRRLGRRHGVSSRESPPQWPHRAPGRNTCHRETLCPGFAACPVCRDCQVSIDRASLTGRRLTEPRRAGQRRAMRSAGLIDLQVNGFAGVDFNSTALTAAALDHALEAMLRTGVTTCLPTLITAPEDVLGRTVRRAGRGGGGLPARPGDGARLSPGRAIPQPRPGLCRLPSARRRWSRPTRRCWNAWPPGCAGRSCC